jgi:hypothetical protein
VPEQLLARTIVERQVFHRTTAFAAPVSGAAPDVYCGACRRRVAYLLLS